MLTAAAVFAAYWKERERGNVAAGRLDEKSEPQTIGLPVDLIHDAKLVLTDELIRASLAEAKAAGKWAEGGEIEDQDIKDSELNDGADRN